MAGSLPSILPEEYPQYMRKPAPQKRRAIVLHALPIKKMISQVTGEYYRNTNWDSESYIAVLRHSNADFTYITFMG